MCMHYACIITVLLGMYMCTCMPGSFAVCKILPHSNIPSSFDDGRYPPTRPTTQPYDKWLYQWSLHMEMAAEIVRVPLEATYVTTPLVSNHWSTLLAGHPDETLIRFFISGISRGIRIGFSHPLSNLSSAKRNL